MKNGTVSIFTNKAKEEMWSLSQRDYDGKILTLIYL